MCSSAASAAAADAAVSFAFDVAGSGVFTSFVLVVAAVDFGEETEAVGITTLAVAAGGGRSGLAVPDAARAVGDPSFGRAEGLPILVVAD